jgi:hypothetical protein
MEVHFTKKLSKGVLNFHFLHILLIVFAKKAFSTNMGDVWQAWISLIVKGGTEIFTL